MSLTPIYEDYHKTGEIDVVNTIDTSSSNMILLNWLIENSLVMSEDWEDLPLVTKSEICDATTTDKMIDRLVDCQLLTDYQAELTKLGRGLQARLGSYRILQELGRGGMGIVYLAEHVLLRR